jgi:hypothetical protein
MVRYHECTQLRRWCSPLFPLDWFLGDRPDERWGNDFEQVLVRGNKHIWEVAFYHKATKTLILVDLIEKNAKEVALRAWRRPLESSEHA